MDIRAQIVKVGVAVLMLGFGQSAMAAACNVDPLAGPVDVTFRGTNPDACSNAVGTGPGGNILTSDINSAFPNIPPATGLFEELVRQESAGGAAGTGTAFGIDWELTADALVMGDFILKWTANTTGALPVALDIVFGLKGGSEPGAAYLFRAEEFLVDPNTGEGEFKVTFLNSGGNTPALSNIGAWGRNPNTNCCREDELPEPGSLALLGLGLLGLGLSRRRVRVTK